MLLPKDGVFLSPTSYRPTLFRNLPKQGDGLPDDARARMIDQRKGYGIPVLSVVRYLGHYGTTIGFAVQPAIETGLDEIRDELERNNVFAFNLKEVVNHVREDATYLKPEDAVFIRRAFMHKIRGDKAIKWSPNLL